VLWAQTSTPKYINGATVFHKWVKYQHQHRGCDRMVVRFTTNYAISTDDH